MMTLDEFMKKHHMTVMGDQMNPAVLVSFLDVAGSVCVRRDDRTNVMVWKECLCQTLKGMHALLDRTVEDLETVE